MAEPTLLSVLPNLSIGVISVLALVYVVLQFLKALDARAEKHEAAMNERETALRAVEQEVRTELVGALQKSTTVIAENGKVMERVVRHLDKH
jgi:hypothetical protein